MHRCITVAVVATAATLITIDDQHAADCSIFWAVYIHRFCPQLETLVHSLLAINWQMYKATYCFSLAASGITLLFSLSPPGLISFLAVTCSVQHFEQLAGIWIPFDHVIDAVVVLLPTMCCSISLKWFKWINCMNSWCSANSTLKRQQMSMHAQNDRQNGRTAIKSTGTALCADGIFDTQEFFFGGVCYPRLRVLSGVCREWRTRPSGMGTSLSSVSSRSPAAARGRPCIFACRLPLAA